MRNGPRRLSRTKKQTSPRSRGMGIEELATVLAVPTLPARVEKIDGRVAAALKDFRRALGPNLFGSLTGPAKRVRPTLTIACAELGGVFDKRVVTAGAAIELVQIGSLIHDDVLEDAPTRRGRPTLNATEGMPVAVVVGDLVLARAGEVAAELGAQPSELLSRSMAQMCVGQLAELRDAFDVHRTHEAYLASVRGKTGALFAAACRLGGFCAGMHRKELDAVTAFGAAFGVMYQVVDDVLDLTGDPQRLGKPVGVDIAAGVYTSPVLRALRMRGGKALARLLIGREPHDLAEATKRILRSGALEDAEAAIDDLATEASQALRGFGPHPVAQGLARFPRYYVDWAFSELRQQRWDAAHGKPRAKAKAKAKAKPKPRTPTKAPSSGTKAKSARRRTAPMRPGR
jgi:heptaprenyl diphosphate synthase